MDRWKYGLKSERKESGFENLKARFQDCNLSRKQENKLDGMNGNSHSIGKENSLQRKQAVFAERKQSFQLSSFQHGTKENHPPICTDGMK